MSRALLVTIWVWLIGFGLAASLLLIESDGFALALIGALLITIGATGGIGAAVPPGVLLIGLGAITTTRSVGLWTELAVLTVTGVVCAICISSTSMSFLARRENRMADGVWSGSWLAIGSASAIGAFASFLVVGGIGVISWPAWILPIPLSVIAVGSAWIALRIARDARAAPLPATPPTGPPLNPGRRPPPGAR